MENFYYQVGFWSVNILGSLCFIILVLFVIINFLFPFLLKIFRAYSTATSYFKNRHKFNRWVALNKPYVKPSEEEINSGMLDYNEIQ